MFTGHGYRRNLPHWRIPGAVYFVTFRLADSIPSAVLDTWTYEREIWLSCHGLNSPLPPAEWRARYAALPEGVRAAFEREQARKCLVELDRGHGACELRHPEAAAIVAGALLFHAGTRLQCGDFVVMPNHVHWLVRPLGEEVLEKLLQSIKQFTAKRINLRLGRSGRLWQKESYDRIVRNEEELARTRTYIAENPAKARLNSSQCVYRPGDPFEPI